MHDNWNFISYDDFEEYFCQNVPHLAEIPFMENSNILKASVM